MAEKEISQHPDSMNTPYEKHLDREQHAGHDNGGLISDALSIEIGTTDNEGWRIRFSTSSFRTILPRAALRLDSQVPTTSGETMLSSVAGIFGPVAAGLMCNGKWLGRKYTMAIGALITMALLFAYTAVRTAAQNVGLSCAISFSLNIYYGTLYAYTPESLPSAHRATGNGIAVAFNRIMGLVSSFVAAYGNTATSVPIYVCAALYIVMAIVAATFPFEPYGKRAM